MGTLGMILMGVGYLIALIYGIQLLILAFKESILWGLGSILVPGVSLIFVIMHWDIAKKPFLMSLLSLVFIIPGVLLAGSMAGA